MSKKSDKREEKEPLEAQPETEKAPEVQTEPAPSKEELSAEELLRAELQKEKELCEDYKRKWYSVSAEYENYRKRTAYQSAQRYQDGRADVVGKLFPIADDLSRALASCNDEATKKGVQMVLNSFEKILQEEKIETVDPVGEAFDAEKHEAIMAVDPAEGEESGTVREVYRKGYVQNGKVLRFAQVIVVK